VVTEVRVDNINLLKNKNMISVNLAIVAGYVGDNPKVTVTTNGKKKVNLSLATTERGYTARDGSVVPDRTEWHNIVCWRNLAELSEKYIRKGSQIFVEGKIRTRNWTDQTGNKRYTTEILADNIRLLDKKGSQTAASPVEAQSAGFALESEPTDNDLPF
jgi:single-strand DNA-binding protein